jgi:high mobility group protein B1
MSLEERKTWKEKAEKDKLRYKVELAMYSGPSTLPNFDKCGPKKDPSAPKRPMSAFLDYSKAFRGQVISENPHVTDNKEISKILGMMWNKASHEVKQPFIIKELALRAKYNEDIAQWRKERDDRIAEERSQRESIVHHAIETGTSDQIIRDAELSRRSIAVDSRNTSNCYGYSASFAYHQPCTTHYHGSEENSAPHFPQRPFDTEVCQHYHHAPYALDDMTCTQSAMQDMTVQHIFYI